MLLRKKNEERISLQSLKVVPSFRRWRGWGGGARANRKEVVAWYMLVTIYYEGGGKKKYQGG